MKLYKFATLFVLIIFTLNVTHETLLGLFIPEISTPPVNVLLPVVMLFGAYLGGHFTLAGLVCNFLAATQLSCHVWLIGLTHIYWGWLFAIAFSFFFLVVKTIEKYVFKIKT